MYGRLKGYFPKKDFETRSKYRSIYCGTCYAMQAELGLKGRFMLTYENTAAFAMASSLIETEPESVNLYCPLAGTGKKRYVFNFKWVSQIIDLNLYFLWLKSIDDKNDEKGLKRLIASIVQKSLHSEISDVKIRLNESGFPVDDAYQCIYNRNHMDFGHLDESLDVSGHLFGMVGRYVATIFRFYEHKNVFEKSGAIIGKSLDLIDMIEDLKDDIAYNRFNPLVKVYSKGNMNPEQILNKAEEDLKYLSRELCCDLAIHLDSLPFKQNHELMRGIFGRSIEIGFENAINRKVKGIEKLGKAIQINKKTNV